MSLLEGEGQGPEGVGAVGDWEEKEEGERMEGGCGDRREKRHEADHASCDGLNALLFGLGCCAGKDICCLALTLASSGQR